jgi:hypothetical protein
MIDAKFVVTWVDDKFVAAAKTCSRSVTGGVCGVLWRYSRMILKLSCCVSGASWRR